MAINESNKKFVEEKRKLGKCPRKTISSSLFFSCVGRVNLMDAGDLHGSICDMEFIYNVECGQVCLTIDAWMTHSKDAYLLDIKKYTLSLVFYLKYNLFFII